MLVMTKEALAKAIQRQPFQPFTLRLADGTEVSVPHRDFISMHPTGRTVIVYGEDEDLEILDVMLVTSLRTNGKPGRGK
jgi:hypothetical protein